tara:strand:+ start:328 stop:561 length:234 start_codon:yes stop_codon:yes gene_type:complete
MSRYKDLLIEVEDFYWSLLNDDGLTNVEALAKVKKTYGTHGYDHVLEVIKEEEDKDAGIFVDIEPNFEDNLGATNGG